MAGRVRTREVCPKCAGEFQSVNHPITRDQIDLICPTCRIRPNRHYVDGRSIKDRRGAVGDGGGLITEPEPPGEHSARH